MSNEIAMPEAQEGTVAPTEVASPAIEQVTSGAAPQAAQSADTPDGARPSRAQERIEELVAQNRALREYGEFFKQRLEESQQRPAPTTTVQEQVEPEPDPDSFDDSKAYAKAYAAWSAKETQKAIQRATQDAETKAKAAADAAIRQAREEERLKTLDTGFVARSHEFAAKQPDYFTVIQNPALSFFNGQFLEAMKASELGPQVAYHIAKSPQLVAKLAAQSIPQRLATLGRLEAELSRPPPPPKVTAAPAPPTPITGGNAGGEIDPSKMSVDEWMKWRAQQIRETRSAR